MRKEPMTPSGFKKLKEELKRLKTVERPKNVRDIEVARSHGDLKENAEYHAAKERQSHIAAQMEHLEDVLARAEVIDPKKIKSTKVVFGAKVQLCDLGTDQEVSYQIVGPYESDLAEGKISCLAPLAKVLIGKQEGDTVLLKNLKGTKEYEILDIHFS